MYIYAFLSACIFAVELYANIANSEGAIAWIHLVVIGGIEVFLVAYLIVCPVTWILNRGNPERRRAKSIKCAIIAGIADTIQKKQSVRTRAQ